MYKVALSLCAALFLTACNTTTGPTAGRLDTFRSLSDTPHGYALVSAPTRAGSKAERFEVRPGDCGDAKEWSDCANNRERSELSARERWQHGTPQWMAFSVYLPEDFQTSARVNTTVGQIHQEGGPSGTAGGLPSYPPVLQLSMKGNRYFANISLLSGSATNVIHRDQQFTLARVSDMRGRWTDILVHFDTSGGTEVLEVFVNGQRKGVVRDFINFVPESYYMKYGIYRSFVSRHGGPMPTQILYIDEAKLGPTQASVQLNPERPVD